MNNKLATETCVDYKINSKANEITEVRNYKSYSSVTQLGLTSGSATIVDMWNAMPNQSFFFGVAADFDSTEVPTTNGAVFILKYWNWRGRVEFYGTNVGHCDYKMYLIGTNGRPDGNWIMVGGYKAQNFSYGSNSSVVTAMRRGGTVTLYIQLNTADLGTMTSWQSKDIVTLPTEYRINKSGYMLFPVVHDSSQNSGCAIIVYQSGVVQFSTRGNSLPGVATSVWVYATCTYCV